MWKFIALLLSLSILISCSGSSSSKEKNLGFTLSWSAPDKFEDGNVLIAETHLIEYRVYYGDSVENISNNVVTVSANSTMVSSSVFDENVIESYAKTHFAMTSVSRDGIESVLSDIITFTP